MIELTFVTDKLNLENTLNWTLDLCLNTQCRISFVLTQSVIEVWSVIKKARWCIRFLPHNRYLMNYNITTSLWKKKTTGIEKTDTTLMNLTNTKDNTNNSTKHNTFHHWWRNEIDHRLVGALCCHFDLLVHTPPRSPCRSVRSSPPAVSRRLVGLLWRWSEC